MLNGLMAIYSRTAFLPLHRALNCFHTAALQGADYSDCSTQSSFSPKCHPLVTLNPFVCLCTVIAVPEAFLFEWGVRIIVANPLSQKCLDFNF